MILFMFTACNLGGLQNVALLLFNKQQQKRNVTNLQKQIFLCVCIVQKKRVCILLKGGGKGVF